MAPLSVHIKHAGRTHDVTLDPALPATAFKQSIYEVTGVPTDRMKVMVKGGMLKDDANWSKIAPKEGQTFMVIGAAGELPKPPEKKTVFLEDLDDEELASALAKPVGLVNLGNTCYMAASVQALRAVSELRPAIGVPEPSASNALRSTAESIDPELDAAIAMSIQEASGESSTGGAAASSAAGEARAPGGGSASPLGRELSKLYAQMGSTSEAVTPTAFLAALREVNPQFAERDRSGKAAAAMGMGGGFAQQDSEECYSLILHALRDVPGLPPQPLVKLPASDDGMQVDEPLPVQAEGDRKKFIEQFMMGEMRRELSCDEAPEEEKSVRHEKVLKVECNINITTNYLLSGIMNSLDQKVEKLSPALGRQANYTQRSRMTRLPAYLSVHMVRFAWRADIQKKAKIMRKVKFPTELDALDLVTDELKTRLTPVNRRLQEVSKDRSDRRQQRKRTKAKKERDAGVQAAAAASGSAPAPEAPEAQAAEGAASAVGVDLEDEIVYRRREGAELLSLLDKDVQADTGANVSGLYDLVAIVTHKGAAADAGHYMGFVKKSAFHTAAVDAEDEDEDWYKFDDDKVSLFPKEKLATLDGGGEDSSAYVLLYKAKPLV
ncbi:hypothetical protein HGRIS_006950 [Hohenbuehelia grisea]|uniref:Ubiquitin carboxyl-terminal hydrolase n=1 Tax=Hohenbuehelia grisea TaxID=104357 RepID=A0ABR3JAK4_9AGAR